MPGTHSTSLHVGIVGAGAIGSYIGLSLAVGGARVTAVARKADERPRRMLRLDGHAYEAPEGFCVLGDPAELADCDVVGVAVKSKNTWEVATRLREVLRPETPVISLQNGLGNTQLLRDAGLNAVHGVVSFNVRAPTGDNLTYAQATSGPLFMGLAPDIPTSFDGACERGGLDFRRAPDIDAVARGKLVLNLNNGVCAAAGVSIADSVQSRDLRRCYAACIREALAVFAARGEGVKRMGKLAPGLIAKVLPWPNALVQVLARPMIKIDPAARSSTLVDLEAGRKTEIDQLNGTIVALGQQAKVPTPANKVITDLVRELESKEPPLVHMPASELWAQIR